MQEPILVVLAAGIGHRFGGLKQIEPIDDNGHLLIDYSIYDAVKAGFHKVVCIIKKETEADFEAAIGARLRKHVSLTYVYQELDMLPNGFKLPMGRTKPWGTSHALLCCKDVIDAPFAVINSDDYYGPNAFSTMYQFLSTPHDTNEYAMVGYDIEKTLTKNGAVTRGVCNVDGDGKLIDLDERRGVMMHPGGALCNVGGRRLFLPAGTPVSMNLWGFHPLFLRLIESFFRRFLQDNMQSDPLTCEYVLPELVKELLLESMIKVTVLESGDQWYGMTYREDLEAVRAAISILIQSGLYPKELLE